ncbi:MAG: hypothetical protein WC058_03715 [Phycisphaeraceae bacterium]
MEIRWPGDDVLMGWQERDRFTAVRVLLHEDTASRDIAVFRKSLTERGTRDSLAFQPEVFDHHNYVLPLRGVLSLLLIQEWMQSFHDNRVDLVVCDEPRGKSRIRSYKGLFDAKSCDTATAYEQREFDLTTDSSAILGRLETSSLGFASCFGYLGDTFKAFGVYGWPNLPDSNSLLDRIFACFESQRQLWQWESGRLLPIVCTSSTSLFFLQGVANESILQLIVYLPNKMLQSYLEVAQARFGAELSRM